MVAPICMYLGLSTSLCSILYNIIFPWVLTFAIIFGLLIKVEIFGGGKDSTARAVSGLVALAIGFFVTAATPWGQLIGTFFIGVSGSMMMFLVVILGILLIVGLTNKSFMPEQLGNTWLGFAALLVVVFLAWMFLGGSVRGTLGMSTNDLFAVILIVVVIGAMWWFVGNSEGNGDEKKNKTATPGL